MNYTNCRGYLRGESGTCRVGLNRQTADGPVRGLQDDLRSGPRAPAVALSRCVPTGATKPGDPRFLHCSQTPAGPPAVFGACPVNLARPVRRLSDCVACQTLRDWAVARDDGLTHAGKAQNPPECKKLQLLRVAPITDAKGDDLDCRDIVVYRHIFVGGVHYRSRARTKDYRGGIGVLV